MVFTNLTTVTAEQIAQIEINKNNIATNTQKIANNTQKIDNHTTDIDELNQRTNILENVVYTIP